MKYLLGAGLALSLLVAGTAYANTGVKGMTLAGSFSGANVTLYKFTDLDTGTNCYVTNTGSVSCLGGPIPAAPTQVSGLKLK